MSALIAVWGKKVVYSPQSSRKKDGQAERKMKWGSKRHSTSSNNLWGPIPTALLKRGTCFVLIWAAESINQVLIFWADAAQRAGEPIGHVWFICAWKKNESKNMHDLDMIFSVSQIQMEICQKKHALRRAFDVNITHWRSKGVNKLLFEWVIKMEKKTLLFSFLKQNLFLFYLGFNKTQQCW